MMQASSLRDHYERQLVGALYGKIAVDSQTKPINPFSYQKGCC
jgi:hypothetical protein